MPLSTLDLANLIENLREGLQLVGPGYRYLYVNCVAAEHGRRRRDELVGRTMMECYPGIERTAMFGIVERLFAEGGTENIDNEFTFPDGKRGWFELRLTRVPEGVLILSVDITERKSLEAQVVRMQRMEAVGQLAGGVAHDVNNLLTVVQACATFIREDLPSDHAARRDVDEIIEAVSRGSDLTRRLLAFSKHAPLPSSGNVDVSAAVHALVDMLRRALGAGVELVMDIASDIGRAEIYPGAFDQIVVNLVVNARDALAEVGRIRIEAETVEVRETWSVGRAGKLDPGRYIALSVTDNGTGMTPDVLEHMFEPFFTTKGELNGTGLGLATCWGLVTRAHGTITVYSELGFGTTFRVFLPCASDATALVPVPDTLRPQYTGERVLVVEHDPAVRDVMVRTLEADGYRVVEAESTHDAVRLGLEDGANIDLLVTGLMMTGNTGLEVVERLREHQPELPALVVSGFTPRSLSLNGLATHALPVLTKPFTPRALSNAVRAAMVVPGTT